MNYLIFKTWANTETNHAGMAYLCRYLEKHYPDEYKVVPLDVPSLSLPESPGLATRAINKFRKMRFLRRQRRIYNGVVDKLTFRSGDTVTLVEYMYVLTDQLYLARRVKAKSPDVRIFGIAHFVPEVIDRTFSDSRLAEWVDAVDGLITLGSSLTDYYISRGVAPSKIHTTFHYLDRYYQAGGEYDVEKFSILAQGNQMRDMATLQKVVEANPDKNFIICQGMKDLSKVFPQKNVTLLPFIPEDELRSVMGASPVSLNVMRDTIGSNVIVTSLGMGMAMVCSNVGSIKDYCSDSDTFFAETVDDFTDALNRLAADPQLLKRMRISAAENARKFDIENFKTDFSKILSIGVDSM